MVSPLILSLKKHKKFYGSKIRILSPAKINLYLNIVGKYPGGFRRIESIFERVSLCDEITIEIKKEQSVKISSNIKTLENKDNLCVQAATILKGKFKIPFGFNIFLKKNIPVSSGLGGGSSNAASVLLGLNSILNLKLEKNNLYQLGAKLGSDVNFFLSESRFAFLEGRGEKVTPLNIGNEFDHFIIWPAVFVSTKEVYKRSEVKLTRFFNNVKILQYALKNSDSLLIKKCIFNALEKSAFSVYRELEKAKLYLERVGIFCKLTGSGSALYTVFSKISMQAMRGLIPSKWSVFACRTF